MTCAAGYRRHGTTVEQVHDSLQAMARHIAAEAGCVYMVESRIRDLQCQSLQVNVLLCSAASSG